MPQGNAAEVVGALDGTLNPAGKLDARVQGGGLKRFRATLDLSLAAVAKNDTDTNLLCRLPKGYAFSHGVINGTVTMGAAATIAVGTAVEPTKYKNAAVFTTPDTPTLFGNAAAQDDTPLAANEDVIMTIGAAALPGAGILVIDIFASSQS